MNLVAELARRLQAVRLLAFDVDGVLTDGSLLLGSNGEEYKTFHVHDGLGLSVAIRAGLQIAVISARESAVVAKRMRELGIHHVYQGQNDKAQCLRELMSTLDIQPEETVYVGDDWVDLPAMRCAGIAVAVANARPQVQRQADWVTERPGGGGAAREVCDAILHAQGTLDEMLVEWLND